MSRLYLTAREYEALLKKQGGTCCVDDCEETDDLIGPSIRHRTPGVLTLKDLANHLRFRAEFQPIPRASRRTPSAAAMASRASA